MPEKISDRKSNRLQGAACLALDAALSPFRKARPHILLACMPKSGSTFFAASLAEYPGFRNVSLVPAYDHREQELCQVQLSRYNGRPYAAQLHLRNSAWTQVLIGKYNLTPVVLVRNFADAVVSFRDHIRNESTIGPTAFFTEHHRSLNDADLEAAIVRLAMPWYMNFYAGWRQDPKALFLNYTDVTANPAAAMTEVFKRAGVPATPEGVAQALEKAKAKRNRFNVGISGRGGRLAAPTAAALLALLEAYPEFASDDLFVQTRKTLAASGEAAKPATA